MTPLIWKHNEVKREGRWVPSTLNILGDQIKDKTLRNPCIISTLLRTGIGDISYQKYADPRAGQIKKTARNPVDRKAGFFLEGLLLHQDNTKYFLSVAQSSLLRCIEQTFESADAVPDTGDDWRKSR